MSIIKYFLFTLTIFICWVAVHEATHYQIYDLYDCDNIRFEFNGLSPGVSAQNSGCTDINGMLQAQANAETVGYHGASIVLLLSLIFFVINERRL
jgi:hypothetical protein